MKKTVVILFILCGLSNFVSSYRFDCLHWNETSCQCDTDEEIIDCNSLGITKFPPLKGRLRGYTVWTLAFNNITGPVPNERLILRHFPDLQLIDLRGNKHLKCDEIHHKFERINVHTSCIDEGPRDDGSVPLTGDTTQKAPNQCTNVWCRLDRSFTSAWLKTYAHLSHTWQQMKKKWEQVKEKLCRREQREKQGLFEITR